MKSGEDDAVVITVTTFDCGVCGVVVRGKVRASKSGDCRKRRSFIGNKRAGEGRDSGGIGQRRKRLEGSTDTTWQVSGVRPTPTRRFKCRAVAFDVQQTVRSVVVDLSARKYITGGRRRLLITLPSLERGVSRQEGKACRRMATQSWSSLRARMASATGVFLRDRSFSKRVGTSS